MNFMEKTLKKCEKNISLAERCWPTFKIEFSSSSGNLIELAAQINMPENSDNKDELEQAYIEAVKILDNYSGDLDLDGRARLDVLMSIGARLGYFFFAGAKNEVYFTQLINSSRSLQADLERLSYYFKRDFGFGISFTSDVGQNDFQKARKRILEAHEFFCEEKGPWIENFMAHLGDDISRDSFATYLRQRILSKVFWASDICYPVAPPVQTATWRREREEKNYDYPVLKDMQGNVIADIYYKCVYVYEQYRLPGIAEARPGDNIIDAGAFVGDSSVYFSRRAGASGKVYAFEIFPDSVRCGMENMQRNGADNVEYFNCAISEKEGTATLVSNENCASISRIVFDDGKVSGMPIKVTSIDAFRKEHGPINFIKADIEGSEMAMLKGARNTIKEDAPTCAICLYHKRDDFWEIPDFLSELRPDYKFWFRCEAEPVLFAKIPE